MKRKWYLKLGALCLAVIMLATPFQSQAFCFGWEEMLYRETYCATPVCHTGNRTEFTEVRFERICSAFPIGFNVEYKIEKRDGGCCPYN